MAIEPQSIQAGWGNFTLTVRGAGFTSFSRVLWDGVPLETVFIGPNEVLATVSSSLVLRDGSMWITIETRDPSPVTSNAVTFTVHQRPALSVEMLVSGNAVFVDNRVKLEAVARDQFGAIIEGKSIEWGSSDANVAVIENGYLRGKANGWTTLTAKADPAASTSMGFHVVQPPTVDLLFESATLGNQAELLVHSVGQSGSIRRLLPPGDMGAQASANSGGNRIAFVRPTSAGGSEIWVVNRDGSDLVRLVEGGVNDQPAWSPDGNFIAFRSTRAGKSDVWVVRPDGSQQLNLTGASAFIPEEHNERPSWSPDGQRIVFSRGFGLGQALFTARRDGVDLRQAVARAGFDLLEPAWSPNGQLFAFRERDRATGASTIGFAATSTGERLHLIQALPPDARTPSWLTNEWLAITAKAHAVWPIQTIALVRVGAGQTVVPLGPEFGRLAEPAGIRR